MTTFFQKNEKYFLLFSLLLFYFLDLGNPQALTQGTEGFYLQITKEMYEAKSFLTPLYLGEPHWSKPPLHFWAPFPFYFLSGGFSLWAARICMVLLTWGGLLYIAHWTAKHTKLSRVFIFIFLASTLAFFKYGRIYMMEMPLTFFSVASSLMFYDYLLEKKKTLFWGATLLLACATLIKGPVALVMCLGAMGLTVLYFHLRLKQNHWRSLFVWALFSTLIASLWFIACYIKYGSEFFNYFFVRENMGKFTAQTYPLSSVFKGLISYSLPWLFFLPLALYHIAKKVHPLLDEKKSPLLPFLGLHFFVFFTLWLIPAQRSYHYAVPSIPFFLLIIFMGAFVPPSRVNEDDHSLRLTNIVWVFIGFFILLLIGLCLFVSAFGNQFLTTTGQIKGLVTIAILIFSFVVTMKRVSFAWKFSAAFWAIGALWTLYIPIFFLPLVPPEVEKLVGKEELAVAYRKPFFVEESLRRPIKVFYEPQAEKIFCDYSLVFMPEEMLKRTKLQSKAELLHTWKIWKRGNKSADFALAYEKNNINLLQENMVLVRPKPCYKKKHEHR